MNGPNGRIRSSTVLPARRSLLTLRTEDGLDLVGELALPVARDPVATLICLHPLPTQGGMMDSHLLRKAANRLPALADLAVLRFNTRGTSSDRGTSEGEFGGADHERHDLAAAISYARTTGLRRRWLLGWSFGTELALKWGNVPEVTGALLLSPPLRLATGADLDAWAATGKPLIALIPGFDDYLRPEEARQLFGRVPQAEVVAVPGAKHLWVGEPYVRIALNEIVKRVNPAACPLPTESAAVAVRDRQGQADLPYQDPGGGVGAIGRAGQCTVSRLDGDRSQPRALGRRSGWQGDGRGGPR